MRFPLFKFWTSVLAAMIFLIMAVSGLALAQEDNLQASAPVATPHPAPGAEAHPAPLELELRGAPLPTYAKVLTGGVPVYQHPVEATLGLPPARYFDLGYVWVTLPVSTPVEHQGQQWYEINAGEYVQAEHLAPFAPSHFKGKRIYRPESFAWIIFDTWSTSVPGRDPGEDSKLFKRYSTVNILEIAQVEDREWYRVEEGHWIEQGMVGIITPKPRPEGVGPDEKWVEVDLYEQTLAAYEGDRMVYATLVSSGLPFWETRTGLFRIWLKTDAGKMSGSEGRSDYYFLEDVPWTMYFHGAYALHGAYWHDRFGIKHSHGCVNMSLTDAKWLFDWTTPVSTRQGWKMSTEAEPGTWVWVHTGTKFGELQAELNNSPEAGRLEVEVVN